MEIVVSDTNIFIDLSSVDLLDDFFQLPIKIHTVDFVVNEIKEASQARVINAHIAKGDLIVKCFTIDEVAEIYNLQSSVSGNLSFIDCSVWHYAKENDYILLTGDRQLRDRAIRSNVRVNGILFVFDLLIDNKVISYQKAVDCLKNLMLINPRMPKSLILERIDKWESHFSHPPRTQDFL